MFLIDSTPLYTERRCQKRVERGIRYLDKHKPGWRDEVNVETLDLSHGDRCILGQCYGSYGNGAGQLGIEWEKARQLGFAAGTEETPHYFVRDEYDSLTEEWKLALHA
jgi:hypothetical protein